MKASHCLSPRTPDYAGVSFSILHCSKDASIACLNKVGWGLPTQLPRTQIWKEKVCIRMLSCNPRHSSPHANDEEAPITSAIYMFFPLSFPWVWTNDLISLELRVVTQTNKKNDNKSECSQNTQLHRLRCFKGITKWTHHNSTEIQMLWSSFTVERARNQHNEAIFPRSHSKYMVEAESQPSSLTSTLRSFLLNPTGQWINPK